jgi:hypothetical protein
MQTFAEAYQKRVPPQAVPAVSATFKDGGILEMVHDLDARHTRFALWRNGTWGYEDHHNINPIQRLVPYSPGNNLKERNCASAQSTRGIRFRGESLG